jgi:hypothetical protein
MDVDVTPFPRLEQTTSVKKIYFFMSVDYKLEKGNMQLQN